PRRRARSQSSARPLLLRGFRRGLHRARGRDLGALDDEDLDAARDAVVLGGLGGVGLDAAELGLAHAVLQELAVHRDGAARALLHVRVRVQRLPGGLAHDGLLVRVADDLDHVAAVRVGERLQGALAAGRDLPAAGREEQARGELDRTGARVDEDFAPVLDARALQGIPQAGGQVGVELRGVAVDVVLGLQAVVGVALEAQLGVLLLERVLVLADLGHLAVMVVLHDVTARAADGAQRDERADDGERNFRGHVSPLWMEPDFSLRGHGNVPYPTRKLYSVTYDCQGPRAKKDRGCPINGSVRFMGVGGKKKRPPVSRGPFRKGWLGLLGHLAARSGRGSRGRSRAARGGAAAGLVGGVARILEERGPVVHLMLDPGIRVREGRGLVELVLVEGAPLRILPELRQDPLGRAGRHVGRRRRLARLEADHVDEEEPAVQRRQQGQEDEQRPHRVGALLLDLLLDGDRDPGRHLAVDARHARALARRRGRRRRLFLDGFRRDGLLGGLVGELQGLGRQAGIGVFLDERLFLVRADFLGGDDQVLFLATTLAADRRQLGGRVGEGGRLLADVEVQDRLVRGLGGGGGREDDRGLRDAPLLEALHVLLLELHLVLVAESAEFAFRNHPLELFFAELKL